MSTTEHEDRKTNETQTNQTRPDVTEVLKVADRPVDRSVISRKKKRRRWFFRTAAAVVAIIVVAGVTLSVWFNRIETRAAYVSATGVALNDVLKNYSSALASGDIDQLMPVYADDYQSDHDGNWSEVLFTERDGARVYSWRIDKSGSIFGKQQIQGQTDGFLSRLGTIEKAKFKIAAIEELDNDQVTIRCVLWARGATSNITPSERIESRAWFRIKFCKKGFENGVDQWEITDKELLHGETVRGTGKGFANITQVAGIDFQSKHNPMLETDPWRPEAFGIMKYASGGVSTGDYDGDGWVDVIFIDGGSTRLYRNQGDATFADVTASSGLPTDLQAGSVALFADLDNDGDQDLLIGRGTGDNYLYANNGDGTFSDISENSGVQGVWIATAAAADYDNDGFIDLYLGRYLDPRKNMPTTSFYTRNGEGNSLLRNNGDLTFSDVTETAGVREGGLTLGTAWGDYDKDGWQDLYVANDFGRNALFKNNGDGTFSDVSEASGTVNIGYGMSSQFADIDNDGDLDIYVAAVHSGQRWFGNSATIHRYLLTSVREGTIWEDYPTYTELYHLLGNSWGALGEESLKGNTLLLNNGDGTFDDVTEKTRVNPHGWYWSSCMFDFDNDTRQDIYTVNGWITGKKPDDL